MEEEAFGIEDDADTFDVGSMDDELFDALMESSRLQITDGLERFSLVQPHREYSSECSYCKKPQKGRWAYGARGERVTVDDYEDLLDLGWLRSGSYLYRTCNDRTCCPNIPIRLHLEEFMPSKQQRKVLRRMEQYLSGERPIVPSPSAPVPPSAPVAVLPAEVSQERREMLALEACVESTLQECKSDGLLTFDDAQLPRLKQVKKAPRNVAAEYCSAAVLALSRDAHTRARYASVLADLLNSTFNSDATLFAVTPAPGGYLNFAVNRDASGVALLFRHPIAAARFTAISSAPTITATTSVDASTPAGSTDSIPSSLFSPIVSPSASGVPARRPLPSEHCPYDFSYTSAARLGPAPHKLTVELVPPRYSDEMFELYHRFNTEIHGTKPEDNASMGYIRHLVTSPLQPEPPRVASRDGPAKAVAEIGTYSPLDAVNSGINLASAAMQSSDALPHRKARAASHLTWFRGRSSSMHWAFKAQYEALNAKLKSLHANTRPTPIDLSPGERVLAGHFGKPGLFGSNVEEKTDLSLGYGTFHQLYRIDGVLMAVSVLDILPNRLSSVYTYYNPDFRHMEWGTYTALREIFWAQQVYRTVSPALSWYDMNFYVHQCSRMSYKRHFKPSEILCPKTLRWVPLDACLAKLDADKYAVLAAVAPEEIERQTATRRAQEAAAIDNVLLEVNRGESYFVSGELSVASKATIYPYLQAFVGMVGPRLASRIIVDPSVMLHFASEEKRAAEQAAMAAKAAAEGAAHTQNTEAPREP